MSDDLRKLIEAVEAGTWDGDLRMPADWHPVYISQSYHGSVDAAIALCEALLPGWEWEINSAGQVARVFRDGWMDDTSIWADNPNPARALLLAVLRAKLMEMENEH